MHCEQKDRQTDSQTDGIAMTIAERCVLTFR